MAPQASLLVRATELLGTTQYGSITMLHRKMKVSAAQAWEIMDRLEKLGIVAPFDGVEIRQVLVAADDVPDAMKAVEEGRRYLPGPTIEQTLAAVATVRQHLPDMGDDVVRRMVDALVDVGWRPPRPTRQH